MIICLQVMYAKFVCEQDEYQKGNKRAKEAKISLGIRDEID